MNSENQRRKLESSTEYSKELFEQCCICFLAYIRGILRVADADELEEGIWKLKNSKIQDEQVRLQHLLMLNDPTFRLKFAQRYYKVLNQTTQICIQIPKLFDDDFYTETLKNQSYYVLRYQLKRLRETYTDLESREISAQELGTVLYNIFQEMDKVDKVESIIANIFLNLESQQCEDLIEILMNIFTEDGEFILGVVRQVFMMKHNISMAD